VRWSEFRRWSGGCGCGWEGWRGWRWWEEGVGWDVVDVGGGGVEEWAKREDTYAEEDVAVGGAE
jgi:hypothetical protein